MLGEFPRVDVHGNDDLSAVELGVNMVLESLQIEIEKVVDSQRGQEITERLLAAIEAGQARYAILDITGVEFVDTSTASHLSRVVQAAQLLGTRCILSGIQPDVALTFAALGVDFTAITTARNLERALVLCLRSPS